MGTDGLFESESKKGSHVYVAVSLKLLVTYSNSHYSF